MKKSFILFIAFIALNTFGQKNKFGLGIMVGEPTGISAKVWTNNTIAFDAAAALSLSGNHGALLLHADFLKHKYQLVKVEKGNLPFYYGLGAKIVMANDPGIGIRIPLGISYIFNEEIPLDIFLEIVPVLNLIPSTNFNVDGAIGVRYYF